MAPFETIRRTSKKTKRRKDEKQKKTEKKRSFSGLTIHSIIKKIKIKKNHAVVSLPLAGGDMCLHRKSHERILKNKGIAVIAQQHLLPEFIRIELSFTCCEPRTKLRVRKRIAICEWQFPGNEFCRPNVFCFHAEALSIEYSRLIEPNSFFGENVQQVACCCPIRNFHFVRTSQPLELLPDVEFASKNVCRQ